MRITDRLLEDLDNHIKDTGFRNFNRYGVQDPIDNGRDVVLKYYKISFNKLTLFFSRNTSPSRKEEWIEIPNKFVDILNLYKYTNLYIYYNEDKVVPVTDYYIYDGLWFIFKSHD